MRIILIASGFLLCYSCNNNAIEMNAEKSALMRRLSSCGTLAKCQPPGPGWIQTLAWKVKALSKDS